MKTRITLLTLALMAGGIVTSAPARPSADQVAKAGALTTRIKTPAVRAALLCRVAFADTAAEISIKSHKDVHGAGAFWAGYLRKLRGIDVAGCPVNFQVTFARHLRAVKQASESYNGRPQRMAPALTGGYHLSDPKRTAPPEPPGFSDSPGGLYDGLDECRKTYDDIFATANQSMKNAPADDSRLAGQVNGLLKG